MYLLVSKQSLVVRVLLYAMSEASVKLHVYAAFGNGIKIDK